MLRGFAARRRHVLVLVCGTSLACAGSTVLAGEAPSYELMARAGLYGPQQTALSGRQVSSANTRTDFGYLVGHSLRFMGTNTDLGRNAWVYDLATGTTTQIGLTGPGQTSTLGHQISYPEMVGTSASFLAGYSNRFLQTGSPTGKNTWVFDPTTGTTIQTGLTAAVHTNSVSRQESTNVVQTAAGRVGGHSLRFQPGDQSNGQDAWTFDPVTRTTMQIGLTGGTFTGSAGFQYAEVDRIDADTGVVYGSSRQFSGASTNLLANRAWAFNPAAQATVALGLQTAEHRTSTGMMSSTLTYDSGGGSLYVAGESRRYTATNAANGSDAWTIDPVSLSTIQIGLTGGEYRGSAGYQLSTPTEVEANGWVYGRTQRITDVNQVNGIDSWVYNPTTQQSTIIGLTGPDYTSAAGRRVNAVWEADLEGHVTGIATRFAPDGANLGQDVWYFNPTTNSTRTLGLYGANNTSAAGVRYTDAVYLSDHGVLHGDSYVFADQVAMNGRNTWIYVQATDQLRQVGLTGPSHTGTTGSQFSEIVSVQASGFAVGISRRLSGLSTDLGDNGWAYVPALDQSVTIGLVSSTHTSPTTQAQQTEVLGAGDGFAWGTSDRYGADGSGRGEDAWVYRLSSNTTVQAGLTGPSHVAASSGHATNAFDAPIAGRPEGQLTGTTRRYSAIGENRGTDTWTVDAVTGVTHQTGLQGGAFTSGNGTQRSETLLAAGGVLAGSSTRYTGASSFAGEDAWYYDPVTHLVSQPTAGAADAVRLVTGYALSRGVKLTDDGFLIGYYSVFLDGTTETAGRPFIYRPDIGFNTIESLLTTTLAGGGWASLGQPSSSSMLDYIFGAGLTLDQVGTTSQSIFVVRLVPAPSCGMLAALGIGVLARRRRRS